MIEDLANASHAERNNALRSDIRVATAIHESGHALMGRLHGIHRPILLPGLQMRNGALDITIPAAMTIAGASRLSREALTDVCFGGYCGELALYDEEVARTSGFWVNAERAANDMIGFLRFAGNIPNATSLQQRLQDTKERRNIVRELYKKYGQNTYKKMLDDRAQLIAMAQQVYEFWKINKFQKCDWSQDTNA